MKKRYLPAGLIAVLLVIALSAMACGGDEATTTTGAPTTSLAPTTTLAPATGEPIKIGHILDLTGPEAMVGEQMKLSFQYAFDSTGNQIAGRPIEIIIGDAQGQPSVAVDVARKMVEQDKVVAIFGPTQIGEKFAVSDYLKGAGVPNIIYNPAPMPIFQQNKWVVGSSGTVSQEPSVMADYLYNQLGHRSIITLTQEGAGGHAFLDPLTKLFTELGGTVVDQKWVPTGTVDYAPYLTSLKDADALVAWVVGADAIAFWTQYHQLGIDAKIPVVGAFHGGFTDPFVPGSMAPEDAEVLIGTMAPTFYSPDSQEAIVKDFVAGLTPILGYAPLDAGSSGPCQAAELFMTAVEATAGDTTAAALLAALTSAQFVGVEGPMSFAPGSNSATKNVYIVKVQKLPNEDAYGYVTVFTYEAVPPTGYVPK